LETTTNVWVVYDIVAPLASRVLVANAAEVWELAGARVRQAREHILQAVPEAEVSGVAADFSSAQGAEAVTRAFPVVDVLVNNVGIFEPKPFEEIPDEDWLLFFETNVMSGVRLSRFYFPKMRAKNWGRIVFVSSESAVRIPVEMIHYGMTKTAQVAVARGLAELTAGTGVTVNTVLPGPTVCFTNSDEVANMIVYVCSQQSSSTNGAALRADGGVVRAIL
jgi:NAD(P)-dependent dehydrogenase (short-subunit alcohol dehydrogenase family)